MTDDYQEQKSKIILSDGNEFEGNKIMVVYKDNDSFPDTGLVSNENWELEEIFEVKMMLDHFLIEMLKDRFNDHQRKVYDKIQFLMENKKQELTDKLTEEEEKLFQKLYSNYDWELIEETELGDLQEEELINQLLGEEKAEPKKKSGDNKGKVINVDFGNQ